MINKVILIGNLGKDPEIRTLEGGATVARFSLATNENYKDKSGEWQTNTEWHNIVAWRNLAQRVERDLKKGSLVYVEGKIATRKWQDKEGNDRYTTEITAFSLRLLEKRDSGGDSQDNFQGLEEKIPYQKDYSSRENSEKKDTFNEGDDDLPF